MFVQKLVDIVEYLFFKKSFVLKKVDFEDFPSLKSIILKTERFSKKFYSTILNQFWMRIHLIHS